MFAVGIAGFARNQSNDTITEGDTSAGQPRPAGLALETVIDSGLEAPIFLTAPAGDDRLFILEKAGRIRIVDRGVLEETPFLDIAGSVLDGLETGLLGLTFHPQYGSNGRFFVYYSTPDAGCPSHRSVIAEYAVSRSDPGVANSTETVILSLCQPGAFHNGGMLAFGPSGNLFIGLGDGGIEAFAQDNTELLGSLLRIDIDSATPYAIPPTNPFTGVEGADEIWATGLRNPWRFSFDGDTLYIGDVGWNSREEIDAVSASAPALDFGWPRYEGTLCISLETETCDKDGLTFPTFEHTREDSRAITGGYVYRGEAADYQGHYFYGDFLSGFVRSALITDGLVTGEVDWTPTMGAQPGLASFGVDGNGDLYLILIEGQIKKIVATS